MRDTAPRNRRTPARSSSGQEGHSPRPGISTHPSPTRDTASQDSRTGLANVPPPVETTHAPSVSRPHTHSRSFADCDAASSPITTPQASPLPPTPPLHARIADAINAAAAARAPPLPLPRRVPPRLPISPAPCGHSPFSQRQASLPVTPLPLPRRAGRSAPQPPFGHTHARAGVANVSADSAASARDVETQLTQYVASATPSPAAPHVPMNVDAAEACARVPSLSYPDDPYPPLRTQAVDDSQGKSMQAMWEAELTPPKTAGQTRRTRAYSRPHRRRASRCSSARAGLPCGWTLSPRRAMLWTSTFPRRCSSRLKLPTQANDCVRYPAHSHLDISRHGSHGTERVSNFIAGICM